MASPWIALGLCFLGAALEGFDIGSMGIAAPKLGPEFHLAKAQLGLALAGVPIGMLIGAIVGGQMADALGRKTSLCLAIVVVGLFQLATAFVPDYGALVAARVACGLGVGAALPNLIALTSEAAGDRRLFNVVVVVAGLPAGGTIAALIAILGGEHANWRANFLIGGVAPLLLAPVMAMVLRESTDFVRVRAADAPRGGPASTFRVLFGGGRAATTLWLWLASFATATIVYVFVTWTPELMVLSGFSRTASLWVAMPFGVSGVVGPLVLAWLVQHRGARNVLILCYLGLGAGLVVLAAAGLDFAMALAAVAVAGAFVQGAALILYGLSPLYYETAGRGAATGAAVAAARLGAIVGPAMAGVLLGAGMSPSQLLQCLLPVAGAAGLAALMMSRSASGSPPAAATGQ